MDGITKFYYLTACAFWFHQVIVLNVEAKRKDHYQMLSHHFITILLVVGSYWSNFTAIGNAILCLMDPCDILLSVSVELLTRIGWELELELGIPFFSFQQIFSSSHSTLSFFISSEVCQSTEICRSFSIMRYSFCSLSSRLDNH